MSDPVTSAAEVLLPETLELLLRGNLNKKTLRAAIASELLKAGAPPPSPCSACRFFDDRGRDDRCELHGRLTNRKNYCSWWEPR